MSLKVRAVSRLGALAAFQLAMGAAFAQRLLLPGDRLEVRCPESPSVCVERTLSFAGSIELPGLPPISLAKLSPEEAERKIEQALISVGLADDPRVALRLLPSRSKRVSVIGLVQNPGDVFAKDGLTLQEALAAAAPGPSADLSKVTVYTAEGAVRTIDAGGRPWRLHAGDRVEVMAVAANLEIFVLGGVERPGVVAFAPGMTVGQAVRQAGGLSAHGTATGWRLTHEGDAEPTAASEATELRAGDSLEVPLAAERSYVSVTGAVRKPGSVPLRAGMKLTEALRGAGGLAANGDFTRIELRSVVGGRRETVNLLALLSGKQKDPVLMVGDTIVVPAVRVKGRA